MSRNIHGLFSNKDNDKGKDATGKDQSGASKPNEEFSVGGATSSTAVMRPVRGGASASGGAGNLIGDVVAGASRDGPGDAPGIGQITLYKNGIKVGQGEFRPLSDPKTEIFLRELKQGNVPRELEGELIQQYGADVKQVGVSLVDKSSEDYVPPKEAFSFAKSQGKSMLDATDAKTETTSFANASSKKHEPDTSKPTTKIQIVLHPRQRVVATFNTDATVLDLYQHIKFLSNAPTFQMLAGFPPTVLTNPSQTLAEANLINASVQQKV